jgi:hypothetical protein
MVRGFLAELDRAHPDLQLQVISALAEGADQLVAEAAIELDMPLIALLPFEEELYARTFATDSGRGTFHRLLESCRIVTMPPAPGISAEAIAADEWSREQQYAQLGVFLSNHCQILLALWDGIEGGDPGGTSSVVNYHLTAVMPGFAVAEESPNLLADNENDLAYHIVCSRDREGGTPAEGLEPLQAYWMTAHFGRQGGDEMPSEYRDLLDRLESFNEDVKAHEDDISSGGTGLVDDTPDLPLPPGAAYVNRLFREADWLAVFYQRRFARGLLVTHLLAILMGLVFILYSEYESLAPLVWVFLALFVAGVAVHLIGHRQEWHRKYLDYRALAEGLRVQVYWNLAGVVETHAVEFAYDNFLQKQDVDLAWIRHVMRSASLVRSREVAPDQRWVDWVVDDWIGCLDERSGQQGYYQRTALRKSRNYLRTARFGAITLWAGILIAVWLALGSSGISEDQRNLLMVLMGVLPLFAAVRDAYSHKKAEKELIKQYHFMERIFGNAQRLLDSSGDVEFRRRVLKAVGNAALEEHAEWILMHRERPLEHGRL